MIVLLAWLLLAGIFTPQRAGAQNGGGALLPDLRPLPPFDLQLIHHLHSGARVLRFSNSVANTGPGPLHLTGEMDPQTQMVTLIQQATGADGGLRRRRLGGFDFHPEHGHWHWEGFSVYEIWSLSLTAGLEAPLLHSGKIGYCMMDVSRARAGWLKALGVEAPAPAARLGYAECGWRQQGISPGWVDTYPRHLPGQSMDVSTLADGVYALRTTVDPQGLLMEADRSNNAALVYFHLQGPRLTVLADQRFARARIFHDRYGEETPPGLSKPASAPPGMFRRE